MESMSPDEASGLRLLAAQYFQAVEVQSLRFPPGNVLLKLPVQQWINRNMFCEDTVWPLPPLNYRTRVLKMILSTIEESFTDPEEDVRSPQPPFLPTHIPLHDTSTELHIFPMNPRYLPSVMHS